MADMNEEKKILDYITISGYETDAAGNLIIKTTMTDSCDQIVRKLDNRNFLSRKVEIKTAKSDDNADNANATEPGYLFSIHEFFTDVLVSELNEHPERLDVSSISFASRTYNQQKNVRSIYTWMGKSANPNAGSLHEVFDLVSYSVATFDNDGIYRLRMYKNGSKQLHNIVLSLLDKPAEDVLSRPDGNDYLISPEEFDVKSLEEIRKKQDTHKNCVVYTFTYNQLRSNVLVDMDDEIELDVPENCLLVVDGEILADARHISIVEKFDITKCLNNALIIFDADGSIGLFDRYDETFIYFTQMFVSKLGSIVERHKMYYSEFYKNQPRLASNEDVRVYNSKMRSVRLKYNPETRALTPLLNSLKPGDLYYRPEFVPHMGRFTVKECKFEGTADEFTTIIERKLGFKDQEKCETLVRTYNANLLNAIKETDELSDLCLL